MSFHLTDEYEEEYERGGYDDVDDMCNQLGLNYDDVYDTHKNVYVFLQIFLAHLTSISHSQ